MYRVVVLAILAIAVNSAPSPCPFNQDECTCNLFGTIVIGGKCDFKTGNSPNFKTRFNSTIIGFTITHENDMSLPDNSFENVPNLSDLNVVNTTITSISEKAFAGLKRLNTLVFYRFDDKNLNELRLPLRDLPALNQFHLDKSTFNTVDLADFSETTSRDLDVYFKTIDTVKYTNTQKFAIDLEFKAYSASINNIDKSVGDLVKKSPKFRLLLQRSTLGACENFDWMTTIRCPGRHNISGVTCQKNGQKVSLSQHLKSVDPKSTCQ